MAIHAAQESIDKKKAGIDAPDLQPDTVMSEEPDDNVDQDGHCITPAYAESTTLNSGGACDDGRKGK